VQLGAAIETGMASYTPYSAQVGISGDGNRVVVTGDRPDPLSWEPTPVFLYEWDEREWIGVLQITGEQFSQMSVGISSNGKRILAAVDKGSGDAELPGYFGVYEEDAYGNWDVVGSPPYLLYDGESPIVLSGDGSHVAVGTQGVHNVDVLELKNNVWRYMGGTLSVTQDTYASRWNDGLSISDNGLFVAAGETKDAYLPGNIMVFYFNGDWWIVGDGSILLGDPGDHCGGDLALSSSGRRIVVGCPDTNYYHGSTCIYEFSFEKKDWAKVGECIKTMDGKCGTNVDISSDGNRVVTSGDGFVGVYEYI